MRFILEIFMEIDITSEKINLKYDFQNHFQYRNEPVLDYLIEDNTSAQDLISYLNDPPPLFI